MKKRSLVDDYPEIIKGWDFDKNTIKPEDISSASAKDVWWECDKGHSYLQKVCNHSKKGYGCPYCSNQRFSPEYNSLEVMNPSLAEEWDYNKNSPLKPRDVLYGGTRKYWWKCKNQPHSFSASINDRKGGSQCPYCSSQLLLTGFNDLATRRPDVLDKWDCQKNNPLTPKDVMAYSNIKVWWKCPDCGHEWKTSIANVSGGTGCPQCAGGYKTSESEHIIFYYIKKAFDDVEISFHADWLKKKEIDIYIPSLGLAIEYDGDFWHKSKMNTDFEKSILIKQNGNKIVRFREERLKPINDGSYVIVVPSKRYDLKRLNDPIKELFQYIEKQYGISSKLVINVERDWKEILASKMSIKKERSFATKHPELVKYWDYEKNKGLLPENFFPGSNKNVWWKCLDCGYEWEAYICNISKRGIVCKRCQAKHKANRTLFKGINDLKTLFPEHVEEWNLGKNGNLNPEDFTKGSAEKVWWKCKKCGYEWQATIANKTYGYGCPKCGRKKASASHSSNAVETGVNDFMTLNPYVAKEWDYKKNYPLTPDKIAGHSNKMVWWKCPVCNNEWQATVVSRLKVKGCPFCQNRRFQKGFNDVFTKSPELNNEWDYEKNAGIDPTETMFTSKKKVWWKCSVCGKEWQTSIYNRCVRGSRCSICNKRKKT